MTLITPLTGKMLIGADAVAGTDGGQRAFNPATNTEIAEPHFGFGTPGDVDRAARLAALARLRSSTSQDGESWLTPSPCWSTGCRPRSANC